MILTSYKLKLEKIKKYMKTQSWEFKEISNNLDKAIYSKNKDLFIMVPKSEEFLDYHNRVDQIIEKLSIVHKIKRKSIYEQIKYMDYDILKLKLKSEKLKYSTLPLEEYPEIIENIRKTIKFSLCSEWDFKRNYTKPLKKADIVADQCIVGQTEEGSYVFSILLPILKKFPIEGELNREEKEKLKYLGRNSIVRLVRGLEEAKEINIESKTKFESNFEKLNYQLSKNVFDNISNLMKREDGYDLKLSTSFDLTDKNYLPDFSEITTISASNNFKFFLKCSEYLEKEKEIKFSKIEGLITQIKKDYEEKKLIIIIDDERNDKNVYLTVGFENMKDYKLVFKAFKNNKKIYSEGNLWKNEDKNKWIFDNIQKLDMHLTLDDF